MQQLSRAHVAALSSHDRLLWPAQRTCAGLCRLRRFPLHNTRHPCGARAVVVQATAESGALDPPARPGAESSSSSSSLGGGGGSTASVDAVYIKSPVQGGVSEFPDRSVVVLGDVPAGSTLRAGGDIIVLGTLSGEAAAGTSGDVSAVVLVNKLGPSAGLSIAGRPAAAGRPGRDAQLMLMLELGAPTATFSAMPGTPPLVGPGGGGEAAAAAGLAPKLGRIAGALAVLMLGLALVLAPGAVLGNLLSTTSESIAGALLDVFIFGYIILQGAGLLADGSELLLEILNPGIVGGVVLPVLGALPDSLIILTSLSASQAEAQEQVAVGIGTLAGSTILLLSLAWAASLVLGRCDISERGVAVDRTLTRGWSLTGTGVTVDRDVGQGAAIMAASVMLYGIVQVPAFLGATEAPQAALAGAVICLAACVGYAVYSVLFPQLQQRRIDAARRKRFRMVAVKAMALRSTEMYGSSLVDPLGRLNTDTARTIFDEFDKDSSGAIDSTEVQGLLLGLQLAGDASGNVTSVDKDTLEYWFKEFDVNADRSITFDEFTAALGRWVDEKMAAHAGGGGPGNTRFSALLDPRQGGAAAAVLADLPADDLAALQETALELEGESVEEAADDLGEGGAPLSARDILVRAVAKMGAGIALCAAFSDPLVEALTQLSRATGIPPFVVGFVLTPLASNSSELVSSLTFAARKRRKNMSLTLSQLYGAVTMNNTLVLGLFLIVVWLKRLEWVYSSEVAVIVTSTLAVGAAAFGRTTFPLWMAIPAALLYPASLLGVFALDTFLGWQ